MKLLSNWLQACCPIPREQTCRTSFRPSRPPGRSLSSCWALFGLVVLSVFTCDVAFADDRGNRHRWGVGSHFWKTVDDLADDGLDDIEDEGLAYVLSYQYDPGSLMKFEVDLEYYDGGFSGSPDSSLTPIGYVIIGNKIYGALGIGITYSSGLQDDFSDPFFAVRVGYVITLLPRIRIDVNANYRAGAFNDLDEADTDAITLGAIVRF